MSQMKPTLNSYLEQWNLYFGGDESNESFLARLRELAFEGELRSCKFRSVCWRIFLGCLPDDLGEWEGAVKISREEYVEIKNNHVAKPTHGADDLALENPLSQNDESSWMKYFKNSELKATIERDVKRTFPEMEYFHNEKVHELLVNVLFCYAREHRELSYRQGMHELLAPLVFIIHCDLQAACHAKEIGELPKLIKIILDPNFLEHDAYGMFCKLMESTNAWYAVTTKGEQMAADGSEMSEKEAEKSESESAMQTKPFQPQEISSGSSPTLAITNKLNHIHNTLLVQHDLQLHSHLNRLEIIPQVFGLRWIRLLFGREFSLQDLLVLWDAVFADSHTLDLVDYLFVAMLIHIRHHLLSADYSTCMQILMKYPPIDDINDIVKAAKDIRLMKERSFSDSLVENSIPNPPESPQMQNRKILAPKLPQGPQKQNSFAKLFKDFTRKVTSTNPSPNAPLHSTMFDPTFPGSVQSPDQTRQVNNSQRAKSETDNPNQVKRLFREAPKPEEMHRKVLLK